MIEEHGRVVAVDDDGIWVETVRASACDSCNARSGCGHAVLDGGNAGSRARVRVVTREPACVGEEVVIGIPEGALMRGALLVYLMPLVLLFVFALIGSALPLPMAAGSAVTNVMAGTDLAAPLGLAGLLVGFVLVRWYSVRHQQDVTLQPQLLRICH